MKLIVSHLPIDRRFSKQSELQAGSGESIDQEIARQVGDEILHMRFEPSTWARAVATSGPRREDAVGTYARLRIERLSSDRWHQRDKRQSLEIRRRASCVKFPEMGEVAPVLIPQVAPRPPLPGISKAWLGILLVGSSGMAGSFGRLYAGNLPEVVERWIPAMALMFGVSLVAAAWWVHRLLPRRLVLACWNAGFGLVCLLVSFGSLYGGLTLVARTPPDVIQSLVKGPPQVPAEADVDDRKPLTVEVVESPPAEDAAPRAVIPRARSQTLSEAAADPEGRSRRGPGQWSE